MLFSLAAMEEAERFGIIDLKERDKLTIGREWETWGKCFEDEGEIKTISDQ